MFTQYLAPGPALYCRLLAFTDNHPAYRLRICHASDHRLLDKTLTTALGTENGLRLGLTNDQQADVAAARKIAVPGQQVITVLV